jgi:hypothetical protein
LVEPFIRIATDKSSDLKPGIHEISTIKVTYEQTLTAQQEITFIKGRDFKRTYLDVVSPGTEGRPQTELEQEVKHIEELREQDFNKGIDVLPLGRKYGSYRAFAFLAPCLTQTRMRLGQIELLPLPGIPSFDHVELLEKFFGHRDKPDAKDFYRNIAQGSAMENPVTVVHFPLIRASSEDIAFNFVIQRCSVINDLLALHRGSYGSLVGVIMVDEHSGQRWYQPTTEVYRGNRLGGWLSGEQPRVIKARLEKTLVDPSIELFLSMYRNSLTEVNLNFGYFRFWNLLEAMAIRYIPDGLIVTDFENNRLLLGGKSVTTSRARGHVYQLIKESFQSAQVAENPFNSSLPNKHRSMWDLCGIWYAFRNAAAHFGEFVPNDKGQKKKILSGYALAESASNEIMVSKGIRTIWTDSYFDALKGTAHRVLSRRIAA